MNDSAPRIVIAGLAPVMRGVQDALAANAETCLAESYEDAERLLHEKRPSGLLIAYHFDEIRPYRFIRLIRHDPQFDNVPILLVRVLRVNLGMDEHEMFKTYEALGVDQFFNLYDETRDHGPEAALDTLRNRVLAMLGIGGEGNNL
jgi:hypothetical protein